MKNLVLLKPDNSLVEQIKTELGCHPVTAQVMVNRRLKSVEEARAFLSPSLNQLSSPFGIKDMEAAIIRITKALLNREKILIFGDYDVDGITSTVILYEFLKECGAMVSFYIPHRKAEGYGLLADHVESCLKPKKTSLLITVDCGSSSHDAVQAANEAGIDVVITDHHTAPMPLPEAVAIINPKRQDCFAGFDYLAGVGVTFSLMICLRTHLRKLGFWRNRTEPNLKTYCDLVGLGTIADVVPLTNDNRILTKIGLDVMNYTKRSGLKALIKVSGIQLPIRDTDDIAYRLAPRINAAGRMEHAGHAVNLLIEQDEEKALELAVYLNKLNIMRQEIQDETTNEILSMLHDNPQLRFRNSLVLSSAEWNEGVLGIVAAKLAERFYRPVILISTHNGIGKGSGRSVSGVNLHQHLSVCADWLVRFGGHPMAAGLTIKTDNIKAFSDNFEAAVKASIASSGLLQTITIDAELHFNQINDTLLNELEQIAPYGTGNSEPLFIARNIAVSSSKTVGRGHRRMVLRQVGDQSSRSFNAILFNCTQKPPFSDHFNQLVFKLRWNRWNGHKIPQIVVVEL